MEAFEAEGRGHVKMHLARSLEVLADLLPADAVLIDGDHNWYTVFNELTTIYGAKGPLAETAPIVICHDVGWPYGRRDQYHAPEAIPDDCRQPWRQGPIIPEISEITGMGLNPLGRHAEREGGPRNGVRTAIEDALAGRLDQVRIVWLEVLCGLAVITPLARLARSEELSRLLDELKPSANWKALARLVEQERVSYAIASVAISSLGGQELGAPSGPRPYTTAIPHELLLSMQKGIANYQYKGRPMLLSPFDLANLQALIEQLRPRTIFEIGVYAGGRSVWMADAMRIHGIDGRVIGVDLTPPALLDDPLIQIRAGNAAQLAEVLDDALLASLPRPFLVIEDSAHDLVTSAAVLEFFDPHLRSGDYIVVEDGVVVSLLSPGGAERNMSGPSAAVEGFLAARGDAYEVDAAFCDRFGFNVTANPNGWLRKL